MNYNKLPTHTWRIISFLALPSEAQEELLVHSLIEESYLDKEDWETFFGDKFKRHAAEAQHLVQVINLFISIAPIEEFFLYSDAFTALYRLVRESIYLPKHFRSEVPFEHSQIYSMRQLKHVGIWDEVRELANQALLEFELYPLEITKPIVVDYR